MLKLNLNRSGGQFSKAAMAAGIYAIILMAINLIVQLVLGIAGGGIGGIMSTIIWYAPFIVVFFLNNKLSKSIQQSIKRYIIPIAISIILSAILLLICTYNNAVITGLGFILHNNITRIMIMGQISYTPLIYSIILYLIMLFSLIAIYHRKSMLKNILLCIGIINIVLMFMQGGIYTFIFILDYIPYIILIFSLKVPYRPKCCPKCGAPLTSAGKFCNICGEQLTIK